LTLAVAQIAAVYYAACCLCCDATNGLLHRARVSQGSLAALAARECAPCSGYKTSDFGANNPNLCYCPAGTYGRDVCHTCLVGRW
jgi:hypothetical protein